MREELIAARVWKLGDEPFGPELGEIVSVARICYKAAPPCKLADFSQSHRGTLVRECRLSAGRGDATPKVRLPSWGERAYGSADLCTPDAMVTLWSCTANGSVPSIGSVCSDAVGLLMVRAALSHTLSRSDFGAGGPAGPRHGVVA